MTTYANLFEQVSEQPVLYDSLLMVCCAEDSPAFRNTLRDIPTIPSDQFSVRDACKLFFAKKLKDLKEEPHDINIELLPDEVQSDLIEFAEANGKRKNNSLPEVLRCYLEWNGIIGHTESLLAIFAIAS